jgi:hypothetical protein
LPSAHPWSATEAYVRREPAKAVAVAMGAGLLLKLLPTRAMVRPLTTLAVTLLPPALLGLGLLKAFELCCQQTKLKPELPSPPGVTLNVLTP